MCWYQLILHFCCWCVIGILIYQFYSFFFYIWPWECFLSDTVLIPTWLFVVWVFPYCYYICCFVYNSSFTSLFDSAKIFLFIPSSYLGSPLSFVFSSRKVCKRSDIALHSVIWSTFWWDYWIHIILNQQHLFSLLANLACPVFKKHLFTTSFDFLSLLGFCMVFSPLVDSLLSEFCWVPLWLILFNQNIIGSPFRSEFCLVPLSINSPSLIGGLRVLLRSSQPCWNSSSNTLDLLRTHSAQEARR